MAKQDNALPSMETMIYTMHVLRERKKYKISLEILKGVRTLSQGGD